MKRSHVLILLLTQIFLLGVYTVVILRSPASLRLTIPVVTDLGDSKVDNREKAYSYAFASLGFNESLRIEEKKVPQILTSPWRIRVNKAGQDESWQLDAINSSVYPALMCSIHFDEKGKLISRNCGSIK